MSAGFGVIDVGAKNVNVRFSERRPARYNVDYIGDIEQRHVTAVAAGLDPVLTVASGHIENRFGSDEVVEAVTNDVWCSLLRVHSQCG